MAPAGVLLKVDRKIAGGLSLKEKAAILDSRTPESDLEQKLAEARLDASPREPPSRSASCWGRA